MTGPGEMIDVVVTERGIAINPRRTDLLHAVATQGSKLPIRPIQDIKADVEKNLRQAGAAEAGRSSLRGGEVGGWDGAGYGVAGSCAIQLRSAHAAR